MEDEGRLLQRAKRGEADAFEALAAPLEGMVYRHCLSMLRHEQDAQDAAQEAMLRAYRAMPRFLGASRFSTWLYTIAHNTCLDILKSKKTRGESASLDALHDQGYDPPSREKPPDEQAGENEEKERLRCAIAALPADMRIALELYHGEGLGYEDIASSLHISVGTVKSRISRARERLRQALQSSS